MKKLHVIAGATASGKTAAAIELAKKINGEIISADSMQIYRGMDIGTAKPTRDEMQNIPHHMIDIIEPDENFSAAEFQARAYKIIDEIHSRGKIPILAGGTGFYINAVLYGTDFSLQREDENNDKKNFCEKFCENFCEKISQKNFEKILREKFFEEARVHGADFLHKKLQRADPVYAASLHANNVKRVARALAFCETTGELFSAYNAAQKEKKIIFDAEILILSPPREILYERINARTIAMFEAGLVDEVRALLKKGFHKGLAAMMGIGYKETVRLIDGEISETETVAAIQQATRNYAKRQDTWFRNQRRQ